MWMVPQAPRAEGVTLWFGAFGAARPVEVVDVDFEGPAGAGRTRFEMAWERLATGGESDVWTCRRELGGLAPGATYRLWARPAGGARLGAPAQVRMLPAALPRSGRAPLRVLLGSCFDRRGQGAAALAGLNRRLAGAELPHLKILCGDQVYVDLPPLERIPADEGRLRAFLAGKYLRNWAPSGSPLANGYGDLLRLGANILVGDDHEFWNNYPFMSAHLPFTYRAGNRALLGALGQAFFRAFQVDYDAGGARRCHQRVTVGDPTDPTGAGHLEIFAIDGRYARTQGLAHYPADLDALCAWLGGLRGPGALVLSQPLFEPPQSAIRRSVIDAGIVDFADYEPLARALTAAPHDVLVLSGDIHCGRIAEARLGVSGRKIVEVVASPISLIPGTKHYDAVAHPDFPPRPIRGAGRSAGAVNLVGPVRRDHVAMLEVSGGGGGGVDVIVRYLGADGAPLREFPPYAVTLR